MSHVLTDAPVDGSVPGMTDNATLTIPKDRLVAAALSTVAQSIKAGLIPAPEAMQMHRHGLTRVQLLEVADAWALYVRLGSKTAWVTWDVMKHATDAVTLTYSFYSDDVSEDAQTAYATHNRECLTNESGE